MLLSLICLLALAKLFTAAGSRRTHAQKALEAARGYRDIGSIKDAEDFLKILAVQ